MSLCTLCQSGAVENSEVVSMADKPTIRPANDDDIADIAAIYATCFPRERNHRRWIDASYRAYPRAVYYVATLDGQVCGYVLWCVKNGFREATIVELEQIAVAPTSAGRGVGRRLIETSFAAFIQHVESLGHRVGAVLVTTADGNRAESLYTSTLGVARAATIADYGSGTEVILYRRERSGVWQA